MQGFWGFGDACLFFWGWGGGGGWFRTSGKWVLGCRVQGLGLRGGGVQGFRVEAFRGLGFRGFLSRMPRLSSAFCLRTPPKI